MEGAPLAVTDTGPLIALHAVSLLNVLCARFTEVLVPLTVWTELSALARLAVQKAAALADHDACRGHSGAVRSAMVQGGARRSDKSL